jgi:hypothetical protein
MTRRKGEITARMNEHDAPRLIPGEPLFFIAPGTSARLPWA